MYIVYGHRKISNLECKVWNCIYIYSMSKYTKMFETIFYIYSNFEMQRMYEICNYKVSILILQTFKLQSFETRVLSL